MSPRNFKRRFRAATGDTPVGYLQRYRIETAKRLLERTGLGIEEVAAEVGYQDPSFFRRLFKKHTQLTPRQYRTRLGATSS